MCKVATVRFIARKNGWDIGDVNAFLEQEVKRQPNGMNTNVKIKLSIDGDLTEDQINELIKQADNCYVHRMLNGEWNIEQAEYIKDEVVLNN
jgi:putative redox protein